MDPIRELEWLAFENDQQRHPTVPKYAIPQRRYEDKTANGLTRCIIDYLTLMGFHAERINVTGRIIDGRRTYTDVLGRLRTVGAVTWAKGSMQRGTADISATVNGKSLKVEVKIGRDRQSEAQRRYQAQVEAAGGVYYIAKTFPGFYNWFTEQKETGRL